MGSSPSLLSTRSTRLPSPRWQRPPTLPCRPWVRPSRDPEWTCWWRRPLGRPQAHGVPIRHAAGLPLILLDEPQLNRPKRIGKRLIDLLVSAAALVLLSPFLLVFAVLVKTTSRGPVLYVQDRVGRGG